MTKNEKLPVYKNVDGAFLRVNGDRRDPNRRYSLVVGPEGSFYREFSDEEERMRDDEEAKWEAERPQREAVQRQREDDFRRFKDSLKYEPRIVAFMDVLGWEAAIERSVNDEHLTQQLGIALNLVQGKVGLFDWMSENSGKNKWPGDPQITHFSDSVLLSLSHDTIGAVSLAGHLQSFVFSMLQLGFIVRGGVAAGPLIHRRSMAYGPALNRAYHLENCVAKFPRIIIDKPLAEAWGSGPTFQHKDGTLIGCQKHWRMDDDGWRFFDFLQPFPNTPGMSVDANRVDAALHPARKLVVSALERFKTDSRIYSKYKWMAHYLNSVIDEYPVCTLEPIDI